MSIQVTLRIRPLIGENEIKAGECIVSSGEAGSVQLVLDDDESSTCNYAFSSVLHDVPQPYAIAHCKRGAVETALRGCNVSIICYGPTGSGKTFTIFGNRSSPGLVPNVAESLFDQIAVCEEQGDEVLVELSFIQ